MAKLVLLVVAAAWAAVLIPPMLRSRVDNRPNSSVTDFRRQLNKLQSTATPARGSARAIGRPLAQSSPLQRQAAGGRPGQHLAPRQAPLRTGGTATRPRSAPIRHDNTNDTIRRREHGDPTGGQRRPRPDQARRSAQHRSDDHFDSRRREQPARPQQAQRRDQPARPTDPASAVKRRRMNVLFILLVTAASTMFLAATTDSVVMLWAFALSFISLCGYVYVLAQLRAREEIGWSNGWLEQR